MISLQWHLRRALQAIGWQGLTSLVLAAAAFILYLAGIAPGRSQIDELRQEAASIRAYSRTPAADRVIASEHQAWIDQFYSLLPKRTSAPVWLRVIFSAAHAQSLTLEQAEYRIQVDKRARLLAYEIDLPVRGSYVQIRKFVANVLEKVPSMALDEIVIKRAAISDPRIEASLRFTLFLDAD